MIELCHVMLHLVYVIIMCGGLESEYYLAGCQCSFIVPVSAVTTTHVGVTASCVGLTEVRK